MLRELAKRLDSLISKENYIARLGGYEFTILMQEVKEKEGLELLAKRIGDEIQKPD